MGAPVTAPANLLPAIEARFAFVANEFGFTLAQSTEIPSAAWFRRETRAVVVRYDLLRDAAVDVELEDGTTGESHRMSDILAFESGIDARRIPDIRERALVEGELNRMARLLQTCCADFLNGAIDAFRLRYREAFMVATIRQIAMNEFYRGDAGRALQFFNGFRAYWTEIDREHHDQLVTGNRAVRMLRGKGL